MLKNDLIPLFKVSMHPDIRKEVGNVLMSGYIGEGPKVKEFEKALSDYLGCDNLVALNSATSALHLAVSLIKRKPKSETWPGVQDGDEVLTSALTCTATNWPALANGLNLKWVDSDPSTCNLDLEDLESKLSEKTKIIIVVHWGGYPVDLDRLKRIQQKSIELYGFAPLIIEDCAHGFGSKYKGLNLGNHGNYACYSFQAIKHLTSVDGGALILPDKDEYQRAKLLRWYGIDRESNRKDFRCEEDIPEWGFKFHMNDVNATIGLTNLRHVDKIVDRHKENAAFYDENLEGIKGVTLFNRSPNCESSFWIYTLKVERQDDFMLKMKNCNIMVSRVHERNDKHSCVSQYRTKLKNLDGLTKEMICIPAGWWITDEQREYIVECIKDGW
tara:strand:+ start:16152 stop:17309 length:1158 start_codon:yes stop_codon:yes gene_type:complete